MARVDAGLAGRSAVNAVPGEVAGAAQFTDAGLLSYMWQFYLPKLPFQGGIPQIERLPVFDIWVETGWAAFGWLEVRFPEPLYVLLALVTLGLVAGGAAAVVRLRRRGAVLGLAAFFALTGFVLLAGLHWVEYRTIVNQGDSFNQGRYLLPLGPLFSVSGRGHAQPAEAGAPGGCRGGAGGRPVRVAGRLALDRGGTVLCVAPGRRHRLPA